MKFDELKNCPFCGSDEYTVREYYVGYFDFTFKFDGDVGDNSSMYDGLDCKTNKRAYCRKCGKYLGNRLENIIGKEAEKALAERSVDGG